MFIHNYLTDDDILNFPNYEDFTSRLEEIGCKNFEDVPYQEIENELYDLCIVLPMTSVLTDSEKFADVNLYRARMVSTIGVFEDLSLIQTYSYPPTSAVSKNGRANTKYKSVFYCSNSPYASILECDPEVGDVGYLGLWKCIAKRDLRLTLYLDENLKKDNDFAHIGKKTSNLYFNQYINQPLGKQMIFLKNFVANKFVNEKPPYYITSFFANETIYGNLNTDFIVYPSSKSLGWYNNFAFHPNCVNENLRLHKVLKFKVMEKEKDTLKTGYMSLGTINENYIKWEIPNKENLKDFNLPNAIFNNNH